MPKLHPAAWGGFVLNCAALYAIFWAFANVDLGAFPPDERQLLEMALHEMETLKTFYYGVLAAQAASLALLAARLPFGLGLAFLGSLFMLPGSLLYLVGCLLTHFQNKYVDFQQAPSGFAGARQVFPAAAAKRMRLITAAALAASIPTLLLGWMTLGPALFGIALAALYCAIRARRNHALALFDDCFTLPPALLAPRILIPYSAVRLATLNDDQSVRFDLDMPKGLARLRWSLRNVAPGYRRQALEELGAALSAHGVPLE